MNAQLLENLDKVLDDVIDILTESGWEDEAAWYDELRQTLFALDPESPQFTELLGELERSFMGLGTFMDIPLGPAPTEPGAPKPVFSAVDFQHQQWGLVSCASGIIQLIKQAIE